MKKYTPQLQRDIIAFDEPVTEYDYNLQPVPQLKPVASWKFYWFKGFGLSFSHDKYHEVWHPIVKEAYNIVFIIVRIQITIK